MLLVHLYSYLSMSEEDFWNHKMLYNFVLASCSWWALKILSLLNQTPILVSPHISCHVAVPWLLIHKPSCMSRISSFPSSNTKAWRWSMLTFMLAFLPDKQVDPSSDSPCLLPCPNTAYLPLPPSHHVGLFLRCMAYLAFTVFWLGSCW